MITWQMVARVFISKRKKKRRCKTAERQKERVLEAEHCGERKMASVIKKTVRENMWCECEIN